MQYRLAIDQVKALAWGLNSQQAMLFAFLYEVPSWADARNIDNHTFYNVAKTKIVAELPLLTDKPDTAYRLMKQLAVAGLIVMASCDNKTYMRLTPKARMWNRDSTAKGSENSPTLVDEGVGSENSPTSEINPPGVGKISEPGSEKSPTNQDTNDQVTNDQNPSLSDAGEPNVFERAAHQCDDGHPVANTSRRFPMTLDWQPDPGDLAVACLRAGLAQNLKPEPHQLAKFTAHHADSGRAYGEHVWLAKLVDWLRNDLRSAQAATQTATGGTDHGNRRQRTPARRQSAAEARRAAAQARGAGGGDTFDGEYSAAGPSRN